MDKRVHAFEGENGLEGISLSYKKYGVHKEGNKFVYR